MTRKETAKKYYADAFACSQAVFAAFGKEMGLTEDQCLKIGGAFGGGMARNQLTCGAVTGAMMVIGLLYGRGLGDDVSQKEITYEKANELFEEFQRRNGSLNCKDLLHGLSLNDPEELKKIQELGLFQTSCIKYIEDAVEILEDINEHKRCEKNESSSL
jgi:C_GCAxxG_C_C family probable redox protein